MRALGMLTTVILLSVAVAAVIIGVRSIPDIQRYLKISRM
ncbi:DUF6893 family small protein [Pseudarthrobacter sp. N5]